MMQIIVDHKVLIRMDIRQGFGCNSESVEIKYATLYFGQLTCWNALRIDTGVMGGMQTKSIFVYQGLSGARLKYGYKVCSSSVVALLLASNSTSKSLCSDNW